MLRWTLEGDVRRRVSQETRQLKTRSCVGIFISLDLLSQQPREFQTSPSLTFTPEFLFRCLETTLMMLQWTASRRALHCYSLTQSNKTQLLNFNGAHKQTLSVYSNRQTERVRRGRGGLCVYSRAM